MTIIFVAALNACKWSEGFWPHSVWNWLYIWAQCLVLLYADSVKLIKPCTSHHTNDWHVIEAFLQELCWIFRSPICLWAGSRAYIQFCTTTSRDTRECHSGHSLMHQVVQPVGRWWATSGVCGCEKDQNGLHGHTTTTYCRRNADMILHTITWWY